MLTDKVSCWEVCLYGVVRVDVNADGVALSGVKSVTIDTAACDQRAAQSSHSRADTPDRVQVCFVLITGALGH
jgi:hypothetical protein